MQLPQLKEEHREHQEYQNELQKIFDQNPCDVYESQLAMRGACLQQLRMELRERGLKVDTRSSTRPQ
eukprot:7780374-Prorocentrum_lima.AAC.1